MTDIKSHDALAHFDERATCWNQLYEQPQFKDRLSLFVNGIKNNVAPKSKVLDYGCGTGRIAIELAGCGYHVDGVDGASGMIEKARFEVESRNLSLIRFETIDPDVWRPRQQYDAIVCSSVLEYVPNDESLLCRFAKALVPGGLLLVSVPYTFSVTGIVEDAFRFCRHLKNTRKHDIQFAQRRYARTAFTQTLMRTGFEAPKWTSFELPILNQIGVHLSRIPLLGVMMLANTRRRHEVGRPMSGKQRTH
jgi:2-polyprenyl-3-methyl-5-hydroxy-6-metoxy-1,4-benzoquinol methylase